jgi:UTP-glucose-1-phosphate uridylyltransferase
MMALKDIKSTFLRENSTIDDALISLEKSKLGICLIKKDNNKLLGILSEGDIRRLILKKIDRQNKIKKFYKKNYFYLHNIDSTSVTKLINKSLEIAPVIDKKKFIKGLFSITDKLEFKIKNKVFIFAGGKGLRLRPLTLKKPKPMLIFNKKPLLEELILKLRDQGFKEFIISVNYLSDKITNYFKNGKKFGVKIRYIKEKKQLGTAGSLSKLKIQNENLLVLNADVNADIDYSKLLEFHENKKCIFTMCIRSHFLKIPYGVVNLKKKKLEEKPTIQNFINTGIYVINSKVFKLIKNDSYFDMNDFYNQINKNKYKKSFYYLYENTFDVSDLSSLN